MQEPHNRVELIQKKKKKEIAINISKGFFSFIGLNQQHF